MKENISNLGHGGAGLSGDGPGSAAAALAELQGLTVSLLAGAAADTKINLAAIREEDTIVSAINNNAGVLTDITGTMSIASVKASGTVTVGTASAGDTVTVAGLTYTLVANDATVAAGDYSKVKVGADADACAANLALAIRGREVNRTSQVTASAAAEVVTVTAVAEGVGGNSIALTETGGSFTVSGATLSGGTATGGVMSSGATDQIVLVWFNKR